jgi:hypothetical protein
MLFNPFSFLKQELAGDEYCAIIKQQNTYPENHISIAGIDNLRINKPATYDEKEFHFERLKSKQRSTMSTRQNISPI